MRFTIQCILYGGAILALFIAAQTLDFYIAGPM